jgi:hypothetical protein
VVQSIGEIEPAMQPHRRPAPWLANLPCRAGEGQEEVNQQQPRLNQTMVRLALAFGGCIGLVLDVIAPQLVTQAAPSAQPFFASTAPTSSPGSTTMVEP